MKSPNPRTSTQRFRDYANLTDEQKSQLVNYFVHAQAVGRVPPDHAAAIAAGSLCTDRQWNGKTGANAYAAALAHLIRTGHLTIAYRPAP